MKTFNRHIVLREYGGKSFHEYLFKNMRYSKPIGCNYWLNLRNSANCRGSFVSRT
jgi:hypothetical protein